MSDRNWFTELFERPEQPQPRTNENKKPEPTADKQPKTNKK